MKKTFTLLQTASWCLLVFGFACLSSSCSLYRLDRQRAENFLLPSLNEVKVSQREQILVQEMNQILFFLSEKNYALLPREERQNKFPWLLSVEDLVLKTHQTYLFDGKNSFKLITPEQSVDLIKADHGYHLANVRFLSEDVLMRVGQLSSRHCYRYRFGSQWVRGEKCNELITRRKVEGLVSDGSN